MKKYIIVIVVFIVTQTIYSQENNYKCYLKNMTQISKNQMTFDIWMEWENSSNIKFHGIQSGIDFDYNAIANGGKLSASIVPNSSQVRIINSEINNIGIKIDEISKQLRIAAFIAPTPNHLAHASEIKIGTFKITNTVSFTTDSKPHFTWYYGTISTTQTTNVVLGSNQLERIVNTTNLINHKIENTEFLLNPNKNENGMIVFQNQDIIHFYIDDLAVGSTTINLFDITGRLVKSAVIIIQPNQTIFDMDPENISNGMYVVKVTNNNTTYSSKLQIK